jgi:hypothetical protein
MINTIWDKYTPQDSRAIHARPFGHWSGDAVADWKKTVSEFQGLQLTYESDRLPAIAVLAERMMHMRQGTDTYIAGMWKNSILHDLCWYHFGRAYERPKSTIPSWSWASIQGNVMWADAIPLPGIGVSKVQYTPIGPASIGEVANASIRLFGRVIEGTYESGPTTDQRRTVPCGASMAIIDLAPEYSFIAVTYFLPDFDFDLGTPAAACGDAITAIIIYRERRLWTGLMLRPMGSKLGKYERIGVVSIQSKHYTGGLGATKRKCEDEQVESHVKSLPLKELTIV